MAAIGHGPTPCGVRMGEFRCALPADHEGVHYFGHARMGDGDPMTPDPTTLLAEARGMLREAVKRIAWPRCGACDGDGRELVSVPNKGRSDMVPGLGQCPQCNGLGNEKPGIVARIDAHLAGAAVPPDEGRLSLEERTALGHAVSVLDSETLLDMAAADREPNHEIRRHLARRVDVHRRMSGALTRLLQRLLTQKEGDDDQG